MSDQPPPSDLPPVPGDEDFVSASEDVGSHLLGRVPSTPDDRDWDVRKLEAAMQAFDDGTADKTIRQLHEEGTIKTGSGGWSLWLAFWKWFKDFFSKPVPAPTPPPTPEPSGKVTWKTPIQLDQGQTGTCVGHGWAGWGNADPVEDKFTENDALAIYYEATCIDGQCDSTYQNGAQVRSGAKAMQNRRRLAAYAFGSFQEGVQWIENKGTVVVGSNWLNDMFSPDGQGFVKVSGPIEGGHCYLWMGYDPADDVCEFQNSWGHGWGVDGHFFMDGVDFRKLLQDQGELCFTAELPKAA